MVRYYLLLCHSHVLKQSKPTR